MLLGLKRLICLHKPAYTIQDVVNEWGFGPNCAAFWYTTTCKHCGKTINLRWRRPNVTLLEPPVLDHVPVYVVHAKVLPALSNIHLPFNTYHEVVEGNH